MERLEQLETAVREFCESERGFWLAHDPDAWGDWRKDREGLKRKLEGASKRFSAATDVLYALSGVQPHERTEK